MVRILVLLLCFMLLFAAPDSVQAASCRVLQGRSICIQSIQRSAKNYWEYRVVLRIDGKTQPLEVYNCRDRIKLTPEGTSIPFEPQGVGSWVCQVFRR